MTKLYKERNHEDLEPYLFNHMMAMTGEGLHSKADIAAELAFRDKRIEELEEALARSEEEVWELAASLNDMDGGE